MATSVNMYFYSLEYAGNTIVLYLFKNILIEKRLLWEKLLLDKTRILSRNAHLVAYHLTKYSNYLYFCPDPKAKSLSLRKNPE